MAALTSSPVPEICVSVYRQQRLLFSNFLTLGHVDLCYCSSLQREYFCRSSRGFRYPLTVALREY